MPMERRWISTAAAVVTLVAGTNVFAQEDGAAKLPQTVQISQFGSGDAATSGRTVSGTPPEALASTAAESEPLTRGPAAEPRHPSMITPPNLGGLLAIGIVCAMVFFGHSSHSGSPDHSAPGH